MEDTTAFVIAISFSALTMLFTWFIVQRSAAREEYQYTRAEHHKRGKLAAVEAHRRLELRYVKNADALNLSLKNNEKLTESLADKDAKVIRAQRERDYSRKATDIHSAHIAKALNCETPGANGTVKRMCRILRGDG